MNIPRATRELAEIVEAEATPKAVADALARDDAAAQAALLGVAADVERMHQIGTTARRDVSPEDLAWWEDDSRTRLRQMAQNSIATPVLPVFAQWLRALAGGQR